MGQGILSRKLLLAVILVSTFYTLLATSYYIFLEYRDIAGQVSSNIKSIEDNYLQPLASSLYKLDELQLMLEMEGALNLPGIARLQVMEQGGPENRWEVGAVESGKTYRSTQFPLVYTTLGGAEKIGTLTVTTDRSWVYRQVYIKILIILASNAIKVFFASLTIYFLINYLLTRHLVRISEFLHRLDPAGENSPLSLKRSGLPSARKDELDQVVASINQLTGKIFDAIHQEKKAQHRLVLEKERLAVTLESIGDGVIATDTAGRVMLLNKVAEQLCGWGDGDAVGRPFSEVFCILHEHTGDTCVDPVERALTTKSPVSLEQHTLLVTRDGSQRPIADSAAPINDAEGNILGVVVVFRDISEQINTEKELLKIQKLESIGVLAGGIAHDFNNILAAIQGNINLALFDESLQPTTKAFLSEAEKASLRAKDLTHQLLTFSSGGDPLRETASLGAVIRDAADSVLHGDKVSCGFDIPDDLWLVDFDKAQISQVIRNIVINAIQAMPGGGTIAIRCENLASLVLPSVQGVAAGRFVKTTIQDSGAGIPREFMDRLFDPYFSTKQGANGLGLAISQSIVRKHGGAIRIGSPPGGGATVDILLPAAEKPVPKPVARAVAGEKSTGCLKVLVMDDEAMIRSLVRSMLVRLGHDVELAVDGEEALKRYRKSLDGGTPVDLVIMDLTIRGGMGGKEAIGKLLTLDPGARVIVSSGYSNDPIMASFGDYGFCAALAKPYRLEDLDRVIQRVMG